MKRVLLPLCAALTLALTLILASTPAQASTRGKALTSTKKFASQVCNKSPDCTSFAWRCSQPRRQNTQGPCKAFNYYDIAPTTCEIGLTWGVSRGKIYLIKAGKAHCY